MNRTYISEQLNPPIHPARGQGFVFDGRVYMVVSPSEHDRPDFSAVCLLTGDIHTFTRNGEVPTWVDLSITALPPSEEE